MRSIALAGIILASTPVDAAACHHYAVWRYPVPQRCRIASHVERPGRPAAPQPVSLHLPLPAADPGPSVGLGDPTLTDEEVRARLLLRHAMEVR